MEAGLVGSIAASSSRPVSLRAARFACCHVRDVRQSAQLALRRLGFSPQGYQVSEEDPPSSQEVNDALRLDLKLEKQDGKARLHVTAVNVGEEPIIVDRELALGIYVRVWDNRGDDAPQELAPRQPQSDRLWSARQWKERTVKLQPGQSTTRVMDLFGGYDAFSDSSCGLVHSRERINKETLDQAGRQIQFIQVDYFVSRTTWQLLKRDYVVPGVPVEQLTVMGATRFLDAKTGKMFAHEEMTKIFDELERKKRRELKPE